MPVSLLGAHTSTAGGLERALLEGQSIGATTVQIFTSNQKRWQGRVLEAEQIERWKQTKAATNIQVVMSHDSYLINLGAANPEVLVKSRQAFQEELKRCHQLDITYLNFHPGAAVGGSRQQCLDTIVESLLQMEPLAAQGHTELLLECTAGQGTCVGAFFEELAYIIQHVKGRLPIGVCMDTCHAFAAGYDMRTAEAWDTTLCTFDTTVGLSYLKALHLNDSLKDLGSRVDRHQPLGQGKIGIQPFQLAMCDPRTSHVPKYLETPHGPSLWKEEIALLRSFAHGLYDFQLISGQ